MIVYLDSSVVARVYLTDEPGHEEAIQLLRRPDLARLTGTITRIEVSGALVRAARAGRGDEQRLLTLVDADLSAGGAIAVARAPAAEVEGRALALVRKHGLRALDAWHLAVAAITLPVAARANEGKAFATRDVAQAHVATLLGFQAV